MFWPEKNSARKTNFRLFESIANILRLFMPRIIWVNLIFEVKIGMITWISVPNSVWMSFGVTKFCDFEGENMIVLCLIQCRALGCRSRAFQIAILSVYKWAIPMTYSCRTDIYYTIFVIRPTSSCLRTPKIQYVRLFITFYRHCGIKRHFGVW